MFKLNMNIASYLLIIFFLQGALGEWKLEQLLRGKQIVVSQDNGVDAAVELEELEEGTFFVVASNTGEDMGYAVPTCTINQVIKDNEANENGIYYELPYLGPEFDETNYIRFNAPIYVLLLLAEKLPTNLLITFWNNQEDACVVEGILLEGSIRVPAADGDSFVDKYLVMVTMQSLGHFQWGDKTSYIAKDKSVRYDLVNPQNDAPNSEDTESAEKSPPNNTNTKTKSLKLAFATFALLTPLLDISQLPPKNNVANPEPPVKVRDLSSGWTQCF